MGKDGDMGLLILIVAAVTGTLWTVLEIAAGVALGIFLGITLLAVALFYAFRRRLRQVQRDLRGRSGPAGPAGPGGPPARP